MTKEQIFKALIDEASFTGGLLASGLTELGYASINCKEKYSQAFNNLSIGLERIGKLSIILDHLIRTGEFPSFQDIKKLSHHLIKIYNRAQLIKERHNFNFHFLQVLSDPLQMRVLQILDKFAISDRYANLNLLLGSGTSVNLIKQWKESIDDVLYEKRVTKKKKDSISTQAKLIGNAMRDYTAIFYYSESGEIINDPVRYLMHQQTTNATIKYRQLIVYQIIRYFVELISSLQSCSSKVCDDTSLPDFFEIFRVFYNDDSYSKTRKTWRLE